MSFDGLRIRGFHCSASGLIASGDPFTISRQDTQSVEVSPMKVCIEACFLDTLHSFTTSWMNLGGYKRDALSITCPKLDLAIATHAMMIEQIEIVVSSSIKASIKAVKSEDFILTCIKTNFKQTPKKSTLNLSAFHPHGHFPFDATKVMLEDTPFLKCPLSNIALFQKLAERSQRVLEVTVERVEVLREVMPPDFNSYNISNDSNHPATLILVKIDDIVIDHHDSRFKHLFLAYFVNDQLALADLRVDIVSCRYSNMVLETSLVNAKESNFRVSLIKRDALTVAIEGDGLLLSADELPRIAHPSLITSSIDFYVHLRRMSVKVKHFKDKDVVMYIDGLKITPKVFYGNSLNVYYGSIQPVTTLYSNPHMKWGDAGLCSIVHSEIITGKICGACMEVVESEFVIVLDSVMMSIFGSTPFCTERDNVDIKAMMRIDEIVGKMDVITSKDTGAFKFVRGGCHQ